jgi:hypothetical protein
MSSRTAVERATVDLARLSITQSQQAVDKSGPFSDLAVELVLSIMEIAVPADYVSGWRPFHLLISRTIHKWLFPMFWDAIQFSSRRENMAKFIKIFSRNDRHRFIGFNVKHVKVTVLRFDADILQPLLEFFPAVQILEISSVTQVPSVMPIRTNLQRKGEQSNTVILITLFSAMSLIYMCTRTNYW